MREQETEAAPNQIAVIRAKYFEAKHTDRFTPNNVIGKLFPELTEEVSQKIEAPLFGSHLSSEIAKWYPAAA